MLSVQDVEQNSTEIRKQTIKMSGMSFAAVDKYKDLVYRTALTVTGNPADAEDIMQEVFFKYFRSHPDFETEEHERSWLVTVTLNAGKNLMRSAWYRRRSEVDLSQLPDATEDPHETSEVLTAVLELPEKYRIAIYLHYYENYSVKEIALMTGKTEASVAQHLSRGRIRLRKKLGGVRV